MFSEVVEDDAGVQAPVLFEPTTDRKAYAKKRRHTESDSYQPPRGYTPPGSYVPPTITGLHPATMEDREGGRQQPQSSASVLPPPDDYDDEVEVVYNEAGERIPVHMRLGPRLSKSQRKRRR